MDIIDVYKSILSCGGMKADKEGFISLQFAHEKPRPVIIETKEGDKSLVLPTDDQLRHGDMTKRVVFHPLVESLHRGESEVGEKLRESITMNLNMSLCYIAIGLLTLSTSTAEHPKLSPDQTVFMSAVKEADEGTIERFVKIAEHMALGDKQKSFVHIFVKRGALIKGKKYHRAAIVSFPFYEELKKIPEPKQVNEVFGVRLRKIDREALTNLLEYMIPGINTPENFVYTSNSDIAPFLDSLLGAMANIATHINAMVDLFGKHLPEGKSIKFDLDWQYAFENLEKMKPQIRMIPQQAGNEGKLPKSAQTQSQNKIIPIDDNPAHQSIHHNSEAPPHSNPQNLLGAPPTPVSINDGHGSAVKVDHFGRPIQETKRQEAPLHQPSHAAPVQPPLYQQPYPNPYQTPQPYNPPPGYHQPQPGQIVRTPYGVDFRSALQARPDIAAAAGALVRPGFINQGPVIDTPRWAMSGYQSYGGNQGGGFSNI